MRFVCVYFLALSALAASVAQDPDGPPTIAPTDVPTDAPSARPTPFVTGQPTLSPTDAGRSGATKIYNLTTGTGFSMDLVQLEWDNPVSLRLACTGPSIQELEVVHGLYGTAHGSNCNASIPSVPRRGPLAGFTLWSTSASSSTAMLQASLTVSDIGYTHSGRELWVCRGQHWVEADTLCVDLSPELRSRTYSGKGRDVTTVSPVCVIPGTYALFERMDEDPTARCSLGYYDCTCSADSPVLTNRAVVGASFLGAGLIVTVLFLRLAARILDACKIPIPDAHIMVSYAFYSLGVFCMVYSATSRPPDPQRWIPDGPDSAGIYLFVFCFLFPAMFFTIARCVSWHNRKRARTMEAAKSEGIQLTEAADEEEEDAHGNSAQEQPHPQQQEASAEQSCVNEQGTQRAARAAVGVHILTSLLLVSPTMEDAAFSGMFTITIIFECLGRSMFDRGLFAVIFDAVCAFTGTVFVYSFAVLTVTVPCYVHPNLSA